jgi:hypothetical protein
VRVNAVEDRVDEIVRLFEAKGRQLTVDELGEAWRLGFTSWVLCPTLAEGK